MYQCKQIQVPPPSHHFISINLRVELKFQIEVKWLLFSKKLYENPFKIMLVPNKNVLLY